MVPAGRRAREIVLISKIAFESGSIEREDLYER
jgi:hypothetical protein